MIPSPQTGGSGNHPGPGRVWRLVAGFLLLALLPSSPLWGCPNCRDALIQAGRAIGYAGGILVLLLAPAGLATFWTILIVRLRRRIR